MLQDPKGGREREVLEFQKQKTPYYFINSINIYNYILILFINILKSLIFRKKIS